MPNSDEMINTLISKAEEALVRPNSGCDAPSLDVVLQEVRSAMDESVEARRSLGPIVGQLRAAIAAVAAAEMGWVSVLQGYLAIGHRPKIKTIHQMGMFGATHVLTLLSESEGACDIGDEVRRAGLAWVWLPLQSGDPPSVDRTSEILRVFDGMQDALTSHARIFIHCSAGIHRTGMITYALLRYLQYPPTDALRILDKLRAQTANGVGDDRKKWGEQFG